MTAPRLWVNGRFLTGEGLEDGAPRFVEALLVKDGLVDAVGTTEEVRAQAPAGTSEVDLEGQFAMPGFNDAHLHLGETARLAREVDLRGARSLDEALMRMDAAARAALPGSWITGGGWDEHLWSGAQLPTRELLDRVTAGHPAVFARVDVHVSAANTEALRRSGVDRHTIAPPGSAIDRDRAGEPTGILREQAARALVERQVPSATQAERERGLEEVLAQAAALGITSVQDNSTDEDAAALRALHARGKLPLRVSEWLRFDLPLNELRDRRAGYAQDRVLRTGMLKAFLDGSLGSRTAALHAPYSDEPGTSGIALYEAELLNAMARERAAAGFQLGFHAIGDRALDMALEAFATADTAGGQPGSARRLRFRVEHAQLATPGAFARAARLGVVASVQPCHLLSDAAWVQARLGEERVSRAYAWRSWQEAGVPLAFGTDLPVEPMDPLRNLAAAVERRGSAGDKAFHAEQCLTIASALCAYTQGSAYAEHAETWKGRLLPGYVADFVVLDRNLLDAESDPESLHAARVLRTVVNGEDLSL